MHLFENGPHGVGMALSDPSLSAWPSLLMNWLRARGLLTKPSGSWRQNTGDHSELSWFDAFTAESNAPQTRWSAVTLRQSI